MADLLKEELCWPLRSQQDPALPRYSIYRQVSETRGDIEDLSLQPPLSSFSDIEQTADADRSSSASKNSTKLEMILEEDPQRLEYKMNDAIKEQLRQLKEGNRKVEAQQKLVQENLADLCDWTMEIVAMIEDQAQQQPNSGRIQCYACGR